MPFPPPTPEIVAALITAAATCFVAAVPLYLTLRKTHKSVQTVHQEITTNHGKRAGEYIEMIPHVLAEQARVRYELKADEAHHDERFDTIERVLDDHRADDDDHFDQIQKTLAKLQAP